MKNNFIKILLFFLFTNVSFADELQINAKNISLDKKKEISIFQGEVIIIDKDNNIIKTDYAVYNNKLQIIEAKGDTVITTSKGYTVETKDINFNKNTNFINSESPTIIKDVQNNKIYLENFNYQMKRNIFKSVGLIKVIDKSNNTYEFSQIYIDENKKELIGSDSKAFLNQNGFKMNNENKPRIFSNSISLKEKESNFIKSTFTTCNYRENDKCPPWELRASKMKHDNIKKTIYYDNAVIRIYNVPIFYFPKLAHPDPTVKRRSGFLIPSYADTKNLGSSINIPYFWDISPDRDFTLKNQLFVNENPLFIGEYRQAFKNSNLIFDFGYSEGYKNTSDTKKPGDKSHFFANFFKEFSDNENRTSDFEINLQDVSHRKYLKLYRIESDLVNYETNTLENFVNFNHYDDEKDLFVSIRSSIYRNLNESYNDKYEFILPELNLNKNLYSEKLGSGSFNSNFKIHNYDTNKFENFLINDFEWSYDKTFFNLPYEGNFLTSLKNVNYEAKNVDKFKKKTTSELMGALGYLASFDLIKSDINGTNHILKPKFLLKYAPNHMKNETEDNSLYRENIFSLNRVNSSSNFEGGSNLTYGFDYERKRKESNIKFSLGQIINERKLNDKMSDTSSLDKRFSDVVGSFEFDTNNLKIDYNYSLDQNFKEMNYNEVGAEYSLSNMKFNLNYLEENNISDVKEYLKSSLEIKRGNNGLFTFSNKRNIITNSSEYYNLSYEYINDCLRAGLVYRREFYNDSELEAENSLMFKVTLSPFGEISSPKF